MSWEYKIITTAGDNAAVEDECNVLGREGWELIGMEALVTGFMRAMFKRPLKSIKPFRMGID